LKQLEYEDFYNGSSIDKKPTRNSYQNVANTTTSNRAAICTGNESGVCPIVMIPYAVQYPNYLRIDKSCQENRRLLKES